MDLPTRRMESLLLAGSHLKKVSQIAAFLGGLQAQDYAGAKWSIALRSDGLTEADIDRAVAQKQIVRTWPMRGTLHFVAAEDLRWILALTAPRNIRAQAGRHRQLGLDEKTFSKSSKILAKELSGVAPKIRSELYAILQKNKISTEGQRGIHLLWRAAQEGLICFAAHDEKQPTFALL
ncbi:MAG: winged helix DNA-binding domain-containing protein, partial [Spirochaetia bacterium]|nr:winged helix DNA-binding domain-containing protein [Spirochaetia bacterium]